MVKSLDALIGYLLDEIALSGAQGATVSEILSYVETFYRDDVNAARKASEADSLNPSVSRQPVDRAFQENVWKWLTRHPDVYVGRNKEGNGLTLEEAEAAPAPSGIEQGAHLTTPESQQKHPRNNGFVKNALDVPVEQTFTSSTAQGQEALPRTLQDGHQTGPATASAQETLKESASDIYRLKASNTVRAHVSEERIWYAVAGHSPDLNRIQRMDFILLSIIAAHRGKGILQPDLTRISGQDKRSTPLRTQRLHEKGYIEKKKVQTKGQVTSLCTLRKFVPSSSKITSNSTRVTNEVIRIDVSATKAGAEEELIDVKALVRKMFDILNELKIITHMDLKRKLGFLGRPWPMRMLARTIRKLEIMGCIRRVQAKSQYKRHDRHYHRCVKFIREPKDEEWQLFWDPMRALPAHLRGNADANGAIADAEGDEEEDEDEEETYDNNDRESQELGENDATAGLQEIVRAVPQWTPDQNLNNLLYDIVSMSDTRGLSTMDVKALSVGKFYTRPVDHQLCRLVEAWQLSQPLNLRHLAIVRDTAISKTIAHYVHYTYENFEKRVRSGHSSWEAVEIVRKDSKAKKKKIQIAPIGAEPEVDEYGFARLQQNGFLGRASNATILESVLAAKLEPFYLSRLDPVVVSLKDRSYGIKFCSGLPYNSTDVSMPLSGFRRPRKERQQNPGAISGPKGRPRKYLQGEAPSSVGSSKKAKKWKASIAAASRYKAMKTRESGLQLGAEEVATLDTAGVNNAMPIEDVTQEMQSSGEPDIKGSQQPQKRTATDAELDDETPEEAYVAIQPIISNTPPNERLEAIEKHQSDAAKTAEIFDADTIRVGTPGENFAVSSHPSIAPSSNGVQGRTRGRPRKKSKKTFRVPPQDSQPKSKLATSAPAGIGLTYEEQAQLLGVRTMAGVYIGERVLRKGGRGRPRKSKLLIARSSRLREFTWFVEERSTTVDEPTTPVIPNTELASTTITPVLLLYPKDSMYFPPVTAANTVSASTMNPRDGSFLANEAKTSVGIPDVVSTYNSSKRQKRRRTPSIPGSTVFELTSSDAVSHVAAPAQSDAHPAQKRRKLTPDFDEPSLFRAPAQETSSQDTSGHVDAQSNAPSPDAQNDAIQLLNDVMNADSLEPPMVYTDAVPQNDVVISGDGNVGAIKSLVAAYQDQDPPEINMEKIKPVDGFPEVVTRTGLPEHAREELTQPGPTIKRVESDNDSGGNSSLDISSSAESQVKDASATKVANNTETQGLGPTPSFGPSTKPPAAQIPIIREEPQQTDGVTEPQPEGRELYGQHDTVGINTDTASLSGKQVTDPPSPTVGNNVGGAGKKKYRTAYPSRSMIAMGGGSVGAQRRKIIMEIIESCGGIFPGLRELWYPFASAWMKTPEAGKPDQRTIQTATKALVDSGKLRQLKFSFRDKKGIMLTKTILTTPQISPTSPAIKDLEKRIIDEDPNPYIPPEADVSPEIRKANQRSISKLVPFKNMAVEKDDKVQLQYIPAYVKHAQMNKMMALERRRIRGEALLGKTITNARTQNRDNSTPNSVPRRRVDPSGKESKPGRVQRLARLQRPLGFRPQVLPSPPPNSAVSFPLNKEFGPIADLELPRDDPIFSIRQTPRVTSSELAFQRNYAVNYEGFGLGRSRYTTQEFSGGSEKPALSSTVPRLSSSKREDSSFETSKARPHRSWFRKSWDYSYNKNIITLLKPGVVFHLPTGTFSTEYLTLRKSRKHIRVEPASYQVREVTLPHRLEDITLHPDRSPEPDHALTDNPAKSKFDWVVDTVQEWELENTSALAEKSQSLHFINHSLGKEHESIEYDLGEYLFEAQEWEPGMTAKEMRDNYFNQLYQSRIGLENREHTSLEIAAQKPAKWQSLAPMLKTRRLTSIHERNSTGSQGMSAVDNATPDSSNAVETRRLRGPQLSRYLPVATVHRLMTAVVVIRTITGGLERNIDWVLVAQLFEDQYDPTFVQSRWATILQKNRLHIEKLQADFQEIFIEAYENNVVPPIDYDNLQDYDWALLVDWAQRELEMPNTRALPSLPGNRKQLDDLYDLRYEREPEIDALFEFNSGATLAKRIGMATAAPFTLAVPPQQPKALDAYKERLSIAKSWVRANVITPEEIYNSEEARLKLLSAGEDVIESALRELISDKILQQENRGRLVPGRNYDISASFLNNLKKDLEATHFHQAVAYKLALDRSFAKHGVATHSYHASDGDVLALTNLLAHKRITIHPRDPPRNKFGLTDGGYKTRFMDKSRLNFSVDIRPSPSYTYGNPLLPLPPPPQQHLAHSEPTLEARIPAWFDIHGNLVPIMWEMALAACLVTLAFRPGIRPAQMAGSFKGSLESWEVEKVLEWMVTAGAARRVGAEGYAVEEWWWACFWE